MNDPHRPSKPQTPQAPPAAQSAGVAAHPHGSVAAPSAPAQSLAVNFGAAMPPSDPRRLPQLGAEQQVGTDGAKPLTSIAHGMEFDGKALLSGPCTISGTVRGNLLQSAGSSLHVTLTETADLVGDVVASQIVVMGKTKGLLDAGGGGVTLHETASVEGHVRYSRLQVNGANLNATLEKAAAPKEADAPVAR